MSAAVAAAPRREAYASLLTNDDYLPGAEVLLHSLRASGTTRPRVVLVTPAVSARARSKLARRGADVREVAPIASPHAARPDQAGKCWADSGYTKLQVWALDDFDVVLYVDVDAVVCENVDHLFDIDCDLAAAPDVFPPDRFNAGVLLLRPDRATYERLVALAPTAPSYDGGDTGFLNAAFPAWHGGGTRCAAAASAAAHDALDDSGGAGLLGGREAHQDPPLQLRAQALAGAGQEGRVRDGLVLQGPLMIGSMFGLCALSNGATLPQIERKLRDELYSTWVSSVYVWAPVQVFQQAVVPLRYRVAVANGVSYFWDTYLSLCMMPHPAEATGRPEPEVLPPTAKLVRRRTMV
ncbi:hypothetical protein JL721_9028 [Aureococcus anophagefferens]|nr:hypothetical protein JL721_9028 [Aureococcus anophagefferens]